MNSFETNVVRRPSTQDVSWFIDCNNTGQLDLSPSYQRKSVWTLRDQRFFLDTIFRGFPCPPIYLHKTFRDGKSVYAVVDGKQRLETVIRFYSNKIALSSKFGDNRLNGKKWKDIKCDSNLAEKFLNYVFPIEFISLPFDDSAYVNDVFDRLNRNAKLLNEQELRHAKFNGWFISFSENEVVNTFWEECKISTKARNKRMLDVQFVSELLLCVIKKEIVGFDQSLLDACYSLYEDLDDYDDENEWHLPEIDGEEIQAQFTKYREAIKTMFAAKRDLLPFLKDNKTFYSIWAYLVLQDVDSTIPHFSLEKYMRLLLEVQKIEKNSGDERLQESINPQVASYSLANKGATTEYPQRNARFEAMKNFFAE